MVSSPCSARLLGIFIGVAYLDGNCCEDTFIPGSDIDWVKYVNRGHLSILNLKAFVFK